MADYIDRDFKIFNLFRDNWALVSAGTIREHNGCTVHWGSFGTLWSRPGSNGAVVTVYIHPGRHTLKFIQENDTFAVSFFPKERHDALVYMGSHSGRDEDKEQNAGLTPIETENGVIYKEAETTLICRKLYGHLFDKDSLDVDIQEYYKAHPSVYPVDEQGEWQPHWVFVGEILKVIEK